MSSKEEIKKKKFNLGALRRCDAAMGEAVFGRKNENETENNEIVQKINEMKGITPFTIILYNYLSIDTFLYFLEAYELEIKNLKLEFADFKGMSFLTFKKLKITII